MKSNSAGAAWFALMLSFVSTVLNIINALHARRTILAYSLHRGNVEVDANEENYDVEHDGLAYVRALTITVTNQGQRPVTIRKAKCLYKARRPKGETFDGTGHASNTIKIGAGEIAELDVKLSGRYTIEKLCSVEVYDSVDKRWLVGDKKIAEFNAKGPWK